MASTQSFFNSIKKAVVGEDFFTSNLYLFLLAAATVLSWVSGKLFIMAIVYGFAVVLVCFTQKTLVGILPIVATLIYGFSMGQAQIKEDILVPIITASIFIVVVLASCLVFFIKNRKEVAVGSFPKYAYLMLIVAMVLGGVGAGFAFNVRWFGGIAIAVLLFVVILMLTSGMRKAVDKDYLCRILIMLGTVLVLETLGFFVKAHLNGNLQQAIDGKWLDYGWGVSNAGGMMIVMVVPAVFYFATKKRFPIMEVLFFVVLTFSLLMTSSRGAQLAFAVIVLPCIIFGFIKSTHKKGYLAATGIGVLIAIVVLVYLFKTNSGFIEWWIHRGLNDSGRIDIYEACFQEIKSGNFLFGWGFFHAIPGIYGNNWLAHCTIFQFWTDFGILGLATLGALTFANYKTVMYKNGSWGGFMGLALLGAGLYGLIDNSYFTPYYTIMLAVFVAVASNVSEFRKKKEKEDAAQKLEAQKQEQLAIQIEKVAENEIPHIKNY